MLTVALVVEKVGQIEIQTDSQCFFREALRERRLRGDLFRERSGRFGELRVRHDFVHHPDSFGFGGVDDVAAQDQFVDSTNLLSRADLCARLRVLFNPAS